MAALMGRTEIGVRRTGTSCQVPADPKARLMYYLQCMSSVLQLPSSDGDLRRLQNYRNYFTLTEAETDQLLLLCALLSPDVLLNKCIFQDVAMCGDHGNEFYELSAVRDRLIVTNTILIGGQQRQVHKIMTFRMSWLKTYWFDPMEFYQPRLQKMAKRLQPKSDCCCCCIL